MNFTSSYEDLQKAIGAIKASVGQSAAGEHLTKVLISADENGNVNMTTSNTNMQITSIFAAQVHVEGRCLSQYLDLSNALRAMPKGATITLHVDGGKLYILSDKSAKASIGAEDPGSVPIWSMPEDVSLQNIRGKDFADLLNGVFHAVSHDDTRPYLNGIYFSKNEETGLAKMVATDGHRLAVRQSDTLSIDLPENGVIAPRPTISELIKLASHNPSVNLFVDETQIGLKTDDTIVLSKLIDGKFPDYQRVVDIRVSQAMTFEKDVFSEAVSRVSSLSDNNGAIALELGEKLNISTSRTENFAEDVIEPISIEDEVHAVRIGFQPAYLLDAMKSLKATEFKFEFSDSSGPVRISSHQDVGATLVLMPMRI